MPGFRYFTGPENSITGDLLREMLTLVPVVEASAFGGLVWPDEGTCWNHDHTAWLFGIPVLTIEQMANNYLLAHPDKTVAEARAFAAQAEQMMRRFELSATDAKALLAEPEWQRQPPENPVDESAPVPATEEPTP